MEKFRGIFWKVLGVSLLVTLIAGILMGLVSRPAGLTYIVTQRTIAVGMGICGLTGLAVVLMVFLEDLVKGGGTDDAA
jgi:hypothetical protein